MQRKTVSRRIRTEAPLRDVVRSSLWDWGATTNALHPPNTSGTLLRACVCVLLYPESSSRHARCRKQRPETGVHCPCLLYQGSMTRTRVITCSIPTRVSHRAQSVLSEVRLGRSGGSLPTTHHSILSRTTSSKTTVPFASDLQQLHGIKNVKGKTKARTRMSIAFERKWTL